MLRFARVFALIVSGLQAALGVEAPLVGVEAELASRLRGPARLRADTAASNASCVEMIGERALALLRVRVPATGQYAVWARARSLAGEPAALSARDNGQRLSAAIPEAEWQWVSLGTLQLARGARELQLAATGALRLDQLVLAGSPDYTPAGVFDTAATSEAARRAVFFSDDFMRTAREAGVWQTASGKWTVTELRKRERFDATRSANAFSFLGQGSQAKPAAAVTGYPFWRNYSVEAAVRSLGGGAFGLIILRQDDDNYYLLRCAPREGTIELLRCLDGTTDRLDASAGHLRTDDWYLVRLDASNGELSASIDGHQVACATDHTLLEGTTGLWTADETGTHFDDVLVRSYETLVERFEDETLGGWEASGDWAVARGELVGTGNLLSHASYGDFELETSLQPAEGEAGLLFDWQSAAHHATLALAPDLSRVEVRESRDGVAKAVASAPLAANGAKREGHVRLRLLQRDGRVSVWADGAAVLQTYRPDARAGRVGLFAAATARFGAVRLTRAQRTVPTRVHNRIFAGEDTMEAWASAASDWRLATAGERTTAWHEIEHWGDCAVRYELGDAPAAAAGGAGAPPGKLALVVRADGQKPETGYQLVVEPQKGAPPKLTLLQGGQAVAAAVAPAGTRAVELRWIADCAVGFADERPLLWHRAATPPPGLRAAIWTEGWKPAFEQCTIRTERLIDDYFETAPVDWRVASGTWEMQNRWTCSPQWSWLGGSSPDAAMLWHKQRFRGDITVHLFAAFQMVKRDSRIYRPADINVSICTDGQNPATGYTFIYGGWNNTVSALLRREKVVASTSKLGLRPPTLLDTTPDMNHLHRKWWHVAIEKHGPKVSCYVDDELVAEYTDPKPLEGGSVCLWTHDNSIMIARAWIAHEASLGNEEPFVPHPPQAAPAAPPAPKVVSAHKIILHDFEDGLGQWAGSPGSSTTRLEARDDGLALAVTNPRAGGPFELKLPLAPFDAMEYPRLSFDYRIPPQARVNLHVKVNARQHAVVLTNGDARVPAVPILGSAFIAADDAWHTADIDLRALLLRCHPTATALIVEELSIGNKDRDTYLTAGFGGNYAGLTYRLDNVRLWAPGPPDAQFTWDPDTEAAFALDRTPTTVPDEQAAAKGGSLHQRALADGVWFFHLRARTPQGAWTRTLHLPIVVDATPPVVAATSPLNGSASGSHAVLVELTDDAGVDPKTLSLSLLDQDLPVQIIPTNPAVSYAPAAATFDPVTRKLAVDLSLLPVAFEDNQEVKLAIKGAKDFLGQAMQPYTLTWRHSRSADKEPPRLLRLDGSHPYLCEDDFETSLGEWAPTPEYSLVERDTTTSARGRASLRIRNIHAGGPFTVTIRSTPFDAGRYPLVSFDYKLPINLRTDLVLHIAGTPYTVRLTDPGGVSCIGAIPDVRADGQWHHTEFNLHEILTTALPQAPTYTITSLQFADTGFPGNADGVEYHIDNFTIAPAASTRTAPLEWKLVAADPSGITAYQHSLTALPAAVRWVDTPTPAWQFRNLGAGIFHFMVRARDAAGNWSPPLQRTILVDDQPPVIHSVAPAPGTRSADGRIRVQLADNPSGINRDKTTLTVAGTTYHITDPGITYDARTNTLTWDAAYLAKPITLPNGADVPVTLHTEDNVGNAADRSWTWKMDYALDKTPPPELYVASIPSDCLVRTTFEDDLGGFAPYGSYGEITRVTTSAATGRYALAAKPTREGRYFGFYAHKTPFDAAKHPILSFDYRLPPGLAVNIHLHYGSSWVTLKLTSPSTYYPVVGEIPVITDDKWHHAEADLTRFLKPPANASGKMLITYVLFADFGGHTASTDLKMHVDNFTLSAPETGQNLRFEWNHVADATGIPGYAHTIDQAPATLPTSLIGPEPFAAFKGLAPGNWFFHLRARDGAGNWGPTTHFPILVPPPTPPPAPPKK